MLAPAQKTKLAFSGSAIVGMAALIYFAAPPAPQETITLAWDNAPGATVTVVEQTTDLKTWELVALVTNAQTITIPATNPHCFYRVAHPNEPWHVWAPFQSRYAQP
jgi:hypothetical protein